VLGQGVEHLGHAARVPGRLVGGGRHPGEGSPGCLRPPQGPVRRGLTRQLPPHLAEVEPARVEEHQDVAGYCAGADLLDAIVTGKAGPELQAQRRLAPERADVQPSAPAYRGGDHGDARGSHQRG
jgi:hypothetical protein